MDEEKEPIKIGARELCLILAIVAIVVLLFNSNMVQDLISEMRNEYDDDDFEIISDEDEAFEEEYDDSDEVYSFEEEYYDEQYRLDCFEVKIYRTEDFGIIALAKNTSNKSYANLKISVIFYDGNKKPISVETEYIDCILANGKWAGRLYGVDTTYETYDFLVEADNYNLEQKIDLYNNVNINQIFAPNTNMSVRFENNTNKKIDAMAAAIYYDKAGNICDIENFSTYELRSNKKEDVESYKYLENKEKYNSGVEIILTDVYAD